MVRDDTVATNVRLEMSAAQSVVDDAAAATPGDAFHNLEAYIPGDRRRALATGTPMPDRVRGAALFADISGFTPLTEALANELGPQRGAEELTANLNRVFHALIADLERFGGHVIYFSGDAITCWIDGDDGARATACALAMQTTMGELGEVVTPAGARVRLAMKAAVAVGAARRFLVGDPDVQLIDVLAGRLIDALATRRAPRGEGRGAARSVGARIAGRPGRDPRVSGRCRERARFRCRREDDGRRRGRPGARATTTRCRRTSSGHGCCRRSTSVCATGRGEFLAELRPAYPLFVRFGGIDYDNDDDAIAKLDDFIRRAQRIFATYGGNLLHLTLGDKGAYLCAVFGPPLAHEDDAARAAAAALELRELGSTTAVTGIQVGITYGRLRSGTYGHRRRQTFTCLGDAVNLSARLMSKAPPGRDLRLGAGAPRGRRRIHLGAARADDREGQGRAGVGVRADGLETARVAQPRELRAADGRPRGGARRDRREARRGARRSRADRRHLGRGRHGKVAPRGRVRADGGAARHRRRARRVPVVRHEHELLRLARGLVDAVPPRRQPAGGRAGAGARGRTRGDRPGARAAGAAARRAPRPAHSRQRPHRVVRCEAAQDLARRARSSNASARGRARRRSCSCSRTATGSIRCRAICSRCSARALASLRVLLVLAYRPSTDVGGGLGIESLPHFDEIAARRARRPARGAADPLEARRGCSGSRRGLLPPSSSSSPHGRRGTRSTSRSCSTSSRARASIRRTSRR